MVQEIANFIIVIEKKKKKKKNRKKKKQEEDREEENKKKKLDKDTEEEEEEEEEEEDGDDDDIDDEDGDDNGNKFTECLTTHSLYMIRNKRNFPYPISIQHFESLHDCHNIFHHLMRKNQYSIFGIIHLRQIIIV